MQCPNCQTEINELKKNFPAKDFTLTISLAGILAFILAFIGTNMKISSPTGYTPLIEPSTAFIMGIGIVMFFIIAWLMWYFSQKPDRCPLCETKIKFDDKTKSFVIK